jgi:hypothetical protein
MLTIPQLCAVPRPNTRVSFPPRFLRVRPVPRAPHIMSPWHLHLSPALSLCKWRQYNADSVLFRSQSTPITVRDQSLDLTQLTTPRKLSSSINSSSTRRNKTINWQTREKEGIRGSAGSQLPRQINSPPPPSIAILLLVATYPDRHLGDTVLVCYESRGFQVAGGTAALMHFSVNTAFIQQAQR